MRRSREDKAATRDAIVERASRLFRERGVEGTSVGDVMAEVGLTHGGFYRHFETKDALVAATLRATFDGIAKSLEQRAETIGVNNAVQEYFSDYLSDEHVAHPSLGCPVPTLGSEIARAPQALKTEFAAGFNRSLTAIAQGLPGAETERRAQAMRELAMRIGAIVIARAGDAATAKAILNACRPPVAVTAGETTSLEPHGDVERL